MSVFIRVCSSHNIHGNRIFHSRIRQIKRWSCSALDNYCKQPDISLIGWWLHTCCYHHIVDSQVFRMTCQLSGNPALPYTSFSCMHTTGIYFSLWFTTCSMQHKQEENLHAVCNKADSLRSMQALSGSSLQQLLSEPHWWYVVWVMLHRYMSFIARGAPFKPCGKTISS